MLRKLLSFLLFFIALDNAFSQTLTSNKAVVSNNLISDKNKDSLHFESNTKVPKENFAPSLKASPEIFYIVNDKPVSREEYLRHNKTKQ
ncbi:MAG: hypothetical protein IPP30_14320 [Flavobacterium sp.]|nr:hypothetical protein [Flavobacterium sp.]